MTGVKVNTSEMCEGCGRVVGLAHRDKVRRNNEVLVEWRRLYYASAWVNIRYHLRQVLYLLWHGKSRPGGYPGGYGSNRDQFGWAEK